MKKRSFIFWVLKNRGLNEIAGRVLDLMFGYLIYPFSFLTLRDFQKWVIGNKTGYCDNSKYLIHYIKQNYSDQIHCIWIAQNDVERDTLRSLGFEAYTKWSWYGLFHCLTASAYFYSSNVSDINYWACGHAKKINMWHGVGIKKLGLKSDGLVYNPYSKFNRLVTPYNYDKPTVFITTSDLMDQHFRDCYALSCRDTRQIGYPRCDFMLQKRPIIRKHIEYYEDKDCLKLVDTFRNYKKVFIYMPTFRDDQSDFILLSGIDFDDLNNCLYQLNYLLLLKIHPATRMNYDKISTCSNIIQLDKHMDIYPILPFTDVLITDYSSIYYDYILMEDKRVILFPFDYESYIKNSRDLAYDYMEYMPGRKVKSYEGLVEAIEQGGYEIECRTWLIEQFWGNNYIDASEKIVSYVKTLVTVPFSS